MTTQKLPGSEAARHGTGDADLTIMLAAHDAFRRDLVSLVRSVQGPARTDPARRRSVAAGWELFKQQLHLHHTAEDDLIWPVLRERLGSSQNALSVLGEMEEEHGRIDPLLNAVDSAFAALTDGLPLIGMALTAAEWRGVGFKIARRNGLAGGGQMFAWMLDGATADQARGMLSKLPPPVRVLYKAVWKPRYSKTERW
jgi:Hemerythrin HHE cation binding domain